MKPTLCRWNLLFILISFYSVSALAQLESTLDSLKALLPTQKQDTSRVLLLFRMNDCYEKLVRPDEMIKYGNEALRLSERLGYKAGIGKSCFYIGYACWAKGDFQEAVSHFLRSYEVLQETNLTVLTNNARYNLGINYEQLGKNELAMQYFRECLRNREAMKDTLGQAEVHFDLADIFISERKYTEAMAEISLGQELHKEIGYENGIIRSSGCLGDLYRSQNNYPAALEQYLIELESCTKIKDKRHISRVHDKLGRLYSRLAVYDSAVYHLQALLDIALAMGDRQGAASAHYSLANVFGRQSKYLQEMDHLKAALNIFEEINNPHGIAGVEFQLSGIASAQDHYAKALEYILSALNKLEQLNEEQNVMACYVAIGIIYDKLGNYPEAMKYNEKARNLAVKWNDRATLAVVTANEGVVYDEQNDVNTALQYFQESLEISTELGLKEMMGYALCYKGWMLYKLQQYDQSLETLLASLKISKEIEDLSVIAGCYTYLGQLHSAMDQFRDARHYMTEALRLYKELGYRKELMGQYKDLAHLDSLEGDFKAAFEHYKRYISYKDSLFNIVNSEILAQMQSKFEAAQKDKEILRLENDRQVNALTLKANEEYIHRINLENLFNRQKLRFLENETELHKCISDQNETNFLFQKAEAEKKEEQLSSLNKEYQLQSMQMAKQKQSRNFALMGFAALVLFSLFMYSNYMTRQQLKLQSLRNKIASDLHDDVGSTLSSIAIFSDIALQESKDFRPLLSTINESSRKMLDAMSDIVWTIHPENDQVEKIILRMRNFAFELLGAKQIDFVFKADEQISQIKLPMEVRKNLYLIFKEATNNLAKYSEAKKAKILLREEKSNLSMEIWDDGKGFDLNQEIQGNGLRNMKKRAEEVGGKLRIDSTLGLGTLIQFSVAV